MQEIGSIFITLQINMYGYEPNLPHIAIDVICGDCEGLS